MRIVQLISKRVIKRHVFMIYMGYRGHKWHSGCAERGIRTIKTARCGYDKPRLAGTKKTALVECR
ncbi:MAG: hypothetical protein DMG72_23455 [Acidobacteria bacterium]|nr:MAG: hypothetical protein DMG72_23455 [Acidobacteriota bacterium]